MEELAFFFNIMRARTGTKIAIQSGLKISSKGPLEPLVFYLIKSHTTLNSTLGRGVPQESRHHNVCMAAEGEMNIAVRRFVSSMLCVRPKRQPSVPLARNYCCAHVLFKLIEIF